jgi:hypothetical protein
MEQFRVGDFIRLTQPEKWETGRMLHREINAFEISDISEEGIKLKYGSDWIPVIEIEPIPIDGASDFHIYYDPIVAANIVPQNTAIKGRTRNTTYYLDRFKDCFYEKKSFRQIVEENEYKFVHEVQHLLKDDFHCTGLRINAV